MRAIKGLGFRRGAIGLACVVASAAGAQAAQAKILHVNSTDDPGSGCPTVGQCTLRGAIYTTVQRGGLFSVHAQILASRKGGPYKISALCGHLPH